MYTARGHKHDNAQALLIERFVPDGAMLMCMQSAQEWGLFLPWEDKRYAIRLNTPSLSRMS